MTPHKPPTPLVRLEALFFELTKNHWASDRIDIIYDNLVESIHDYIVDSIIQLTPKMGHPMIEIAFLQFIDQYIHHKNWKLRVCAIIFLSILIVKCRQKPSEKDEGDIWWKPLQRTLEEYSWGVLNDPTPRVLEFWALEYQQATADYWFDWEKDTFRSLGPSKDQLQTIDLDKLIRTILELDPEVRLGCFWVTVCLIAERVRCGEGAAMKPFLVQLVEMALQESNNVWRSTDEGYLESDDQGWLVLKLVELLWQNPPLHISRQLIEAVIDLVLHVGSTDPDDPYTRIVEYTEFLGRPITHVKDLDLLDYFLNAYFKGVDLCGSFVASLSSIIDTWFQLTLETKWDEGTHFLLMRAIDETSDAYRGKFWEDANAEYVFTKTTTKLLEQYLGMNKSLDRPLLEHLAEWFKASLDYLQRPHRPLNDYIIDYRAWTFPFRPTLITLGQILEQQGDTALLDYCLATQLLPVLHGALESAFTSVNHQWIHKIMTALLERYIPLWERDLAFVDHIELTSLGTPRNSDRTISSQEFPRNLNLQVLADLICKAPTNPSLWGRTLTHLYATHGVWILRWLIDGLLYLIYTSENWSSGVKAVGTIWTHASIPSQPFVAQEADEIIWLLMILQGCAADPTIHPSLIENATTPTIPLPLRKLFLALQTRYGSAGIDALIPLEKWYPKPLREMAAWVLGTICDTRAVPTLLDSMQDESPNLRTRCAWALGEIQDSRTFDPLLGLLADPEPAVRIEGIRALGKLGDPQAIQPLFDIWEALKAQKKKIGDRVPSGLMGIYWSWKKSVEVVREALQQLEINVLPLTEK